MKLLAAEGTRWALIGGYAIAAHGFVRMSEGIDILGGCAADVVCARIPPCLLTIKTPRPGSDASGA